MTWHNTQYTLHNVQATKRRKPVLQEWELAWGERVREEREDRDWSKERLAELLEVDVTTVFRIEKGELRPSENLKYRIAGVFKIRMDRLWAYPALIPEWPIES